MKKIKELMKLFSYGVSDSIQNALVPQFIIFMRSNPHHVRINIETWPCPFMA